jgi:hypothetical protein
MCVAGEKVLMFFFPPKNYEMRLGRWCRRTASSPLLLPLSLHSAFASPPSPSLSAFAPPPSPSLIANFVPVVILIILVIESRPTIDIGGGHRGSNTIAIDPSREWEKEFFGLARSALPDDLGDAPPI